MGLTAALGVGSALLGAQRGAAQRKAQQRANQAEATKTQFSDITGQQGTISPVTASGLGGAISGGLGGLSLAQKFGKGGQFENLYKGDDPKPQLISDTPQIGQQPQSLFSGLQKNKFV